MYRILLLNLIGLAFVFPFEKHSSAPLGVISEPIHVTDAAFEKTVLQSELPVLVEFWVPWCGACKMVAPTLDILASEYAGKLIIAKVNTDENPEWAQKFGVQGVPTMLFMMDGELIHMQVGALPEAMLRSVVEQFLSVCSVRSDNSTNRVGFFRMRNIFPK